VCVIVQPFLVAEFLVNNFVGEKFWWKERREQLQSHTKYDVVSL